MERPMTIRRRRALVTGLAAVLTAAVVAPGWFSDATAHEPELSRYGYWSDIRPLMERHCASCHSGAGPAPVNLMRYLDALPWANSIARQVLERKMPPWLPDDGTGAFAHARTLNERETDMLVDWAIGLAPEGPVPAKEPGIPAANTDLPMSRLTLAEPVTIGEMESEAAVCRPLVRGADVGPAAAGFALIPGEAVSILRRAVLFAGTDCESGSPLFTWVVGQGPRMRPGGAFDHLPEDTGLFIQLTYRKGFDTEGLAFDDEPQVVVFAPPADRGHPVEILAVEPGTTPVGPATLLSVLPPEGLDPGPDGFAVEAVGRDGAVTPLLRIRRFDADWAEKFAFREPVPLAAGAAIRVSHPGAIVDLVRTPATGPDEDP
jgi:hypothetical protein